MEKSLEELVAELSTASTTNEPMVVDLGGVAPDKVAAVSQSVLPEVQEMINTNEESFYNQNINKDMNVLEKEYVKMERNAAVIDAKILKFKEEHKDIFDALEVLESEKEKALEHKEDYREVIANKLASIGEKKWKGMEVEFTYVAPSFKSVFNKKRFEAEQPKLYEHYLDTTPVNAYVKTKLNLLPVLPEDIK